MGEPEDIDQFLYGDEASFIQQMSANEAGQEESAMQNIDEPANDLAEADVTVTAKEEDDDESEEEELEIILDGSSGPAKRGLTQVSMSSDAAKTGSSATAAAKTSVDVEAPGMLNGEVIYNIEIDSLPEKPWRMPGADITDYFNYGFSEQTWREYCLKQRTIRDEYGTQKKIAVFDGSMPSGPPVPMFAPPPGAPGRPPMLPPGMPPFPFPIPPGGALPFPPFMFPGMPPPPPPTLPVKSDSSVTTEKQTERADEDEGRDREKDRDRSDRDYRSSSRRDRRSPTRHRSRSRSKDRDSKRRR